MKTKKSTYNENKENAVFAKKLRQIAKEEGVTQQALADYIGKQTGETITRQSVGQWFIGATCPPLRTVPLIAEFFGVSTDYLLTETETKSPDVNIQALCEYTGLSEKSIRNLTEMKKSELKTNLLLENIIIEDIIKHLSEIERLEKARRYFELVIEPINHGGDFYDNLTLDNVRVCTRCEQDCEKCDADIKWDKDFILALICKGLDETVRHEFGPEVPYCSDEYQDKLDLEEFKLTKSVAKIVEVIKDNVDCSSYFLEKNRQVKECLIKELKELEIRLDADYKSGKKNQNNNASRMSDLKAKKKAIQTYLEKYDENFKLKEGADENGKHKQENE